MVKFLIDREQQASDWDKDWDQLQNFAIDNCQSVRVYVCVWVVGWAIVANSVRSDRRRNAGAMPNQLCWLLWLASPPSGECDFFAHRCAHTHTQIAIRVDDCWFKSVKSSHMFG